MHEGVFENHNFRIIYITKKETSKDIGVDSCVKIICKSRLILKDFTSSGEMYFPKYKLENSSNHLISIEIVEKRKMSQMSIRIILKKLFPTVFDSKIISKLNLRAFLVKNKERIRSICCNILGAKFIKISKVIESLDTSFEQIDSEEEIMFDDIIENEYFQMQLQE